MNAKAIVGALIGGAVGAGVWAIITVVSGFEIGYVAWAVGLAVGFGAQRLGGRGQSMGIVCAGIALLAIFAGKVWAMQIAAPTQLKEQLRASFTEDVYQTMLADAEALVEVSSEQEYPTFIFEHGYSQGGSRDEVTQEEIDGFTEFMAPFLTDMHHEKPSFEQWQSTYIRALTRRFLEDFDVSQAAIDDLGPIDIIFALLGLATAYKMVASQGETA